MKRRYKFIGSYAGKYYWQCTNVRNGSLTEELSCGIAWFWNNQKGLSNGSR